MTAAAPSLEDSSLVTAVRRGDDRAFEELYQRYCTRITAYVRGMVKDHARAEDVTQEVFFSALRRMRQTEQPIAFKPWIYEIARNACIDSYRRTSRAEELSYDVEGGLGKADTMRLVSSTPGPDDAIECKQQLDDLCGAFGGLSETHHQILVLRELEGLSYREIGERLGMSRAAVESTLFRARRRLTEEYDELVSGRRCQRVQAIMAAAAEGMLGTRDRRRMARHLSTCHACRREALHLGVELGERTSVVARIAGLIPFPLPFLAARGRAGGVGADAGHTSFAAHASATLGAAAEPIAATWSKAVVALSVLAVAGAGAGAVSPHGISLPGLAPLGEAHAPLAPDLTIGGHGLGMERVPGLSGRILPAPAAAGVAAAKAGGAARPAQRDRRGALEATIRDGVAGGRQSAAAAPLPAVPGSVPHVPATGAGGSSGGSGAPAGTPSAPHGPEMTVPRVAAPAAEKPKAPAADAPSTTPPPPPSTPPVASAAAAGSAPSSLAS
jgi:RNA polymerase sigma factor (sigma-70 family)